APGDQVLRRQCVLPDDPARLAHTDLRRRVNECTVGEAWNVLAQEGKDFHHLTPPDDLRLRQVLRVRAVRPEDAADVDTPDAFLRALIEAQPLAWDRVIAVRLRGPDARTEGHPLFDLLGMLPEILCYLPAIDVANAEEHRHRLREPVRGAPDRE